MDDQDRQAQIGCVVLIGVALAGIMLGFWLGTTHR
jgi:hypothetical protein